MSKKNGKSRKNDPLYKIVLATAALELVKVVIELITILVE